MGSHKGRPCGLFAVLNSLEDPGYRSAGNLLGRALSGLRGGILNHDGFGYQTDVVAFFVKAIVATINECG